MALITLDTIGDALKTIYLPAVIPQIDEGTSALLAAIEKNSENIVAGNIQMAMRYGRNGGVGTSTENGTMPTPGNRKTLQVTYPTKNLFAVISFTDKMLKVANAGKALFANTVDGVMKDCLSDIKDLFAKMLYGDTRGTMAICTSQGASVTVAVNANPGTKYLMEGMLIDIVDAATGLTVVASGREITYVHPTDNTIIISGAAVATATTDIIVVANSYGNNLTGFADIFSATGNIYGKTKTSYSFLTPTLTNVGGELDDMDIQKGIDDASTRAGAMVDMLVCSLGVRRAFVYLQSALKQNTEIMELKGGYKVISYNGIPITADKYCKNGSMYQLELADFKLHQLNDWEWMDKNGSMFTKVANKPAYEASLSKYCDIGCVKLSGQTELFGITEH